MVSNLHEEFPLVIKNFQRKLSAYFNEDRIARVNST